MTSEVILSEYEIQATRLNQLEYHRLQRNINLLHDDLEQRLARLKRQARYLRYYYTNVVKVVKPNRRYQLWKQTFAYEIEREEKKNWLRSIKFRQNCEPETCQQIPSSNEVSSQSVRPLLLFLGNNVEKPDKLISENILRPKTSPANAHSSNQHRVKFNTHIRNEIQPKSSKSSSASPLPFLTPTDSGKIVPDKFNTTQKAANRDVLYQMDFKIKQRIDQRKLLDKESALQYRAFKGTMRSAGLTG